jgi:hypothetical protein
MKVLFLDIDGCLNTKMSLCQYGSNRIDNNKVKMLKEIVDNTGCRIVLSSTWRLLSTRKIVVRELAREGLSIFDDTPDFPHLDRSQEIQYWLDNNPTKKYAVVDDFDLTIDHLFKTTFEVGLTKQHVEAIVKHLNS